MSISGIGQTTNSFLQGIQQLQSSQAGQTPSSAVSDPDHDGDVDSGNGIDTDSDGSGKGQFINTKA